MRKAVWSKHAFCCAHVVREHLVMVKMARKKEGTWTANSTKRCKQVQMRRLLVEIRVIQRKGGFVAVRNVKNMEGMIHSRLEKVGKRMDLWLVRT